MKERRFHNHYWHDDYAGRVIGRVTNNITNVTNITNVHVHGGHGRHGGHGGYGHKHGKRNRGHGRKRPELLTFFQSCGLLDQDKVMRMDADRLVRGTMDVVRYNTDDFKRNVRGIGNDLFKIGRGTVGLGKCACKLVGNVVGFVSRILD